MGWLFPRLFAGVLAVVAGALVGLLIGGISHWPAVGACIGAATAALLYGFVDAWRAHRFMDWLRAQNEGPAPRDAGFWGEVGYRVERSVRLLERRVDTENARLDQFLSAIEASPNGVLMLDENDQIEWCNSVAADHFGLDPQRDKRQRITNLVRAPAFVAYLQAGVYDEAISFGGPGSRGTISVLVRPYGEGMKLVLSQDITERERNDAMRRDFVANVSHEIRTPLTVLSGFLETMGNLPLTEVERRRVLELMSQQTVRMQTLVGDLPTLDRALLSRGWQPVAGHRRNRPGPVHRQARGATPWRRAGDRQRAGQGFELQALVSGGADSVHRAGGRPAAGTRPNRRGLRTT